MYGARPRTRRMSGDRHSKTGNIISFFVTKSSCCSNWLLYGWACLKIGPAAWPGVDHVRLRGTAGNEGVELGNCCVRLAPRLHASSERSVPLRSSEILHVVQIFGLRYRKV